MLRIGSKQFRQLGLETETRFYKSLRLDLRVFMESQAPEVSIYDVDCRISHIFNSHRTERITFSPDIIRYSYIIVVFAEDFRLIPRYSWLAEVLASDEPAARRLDRIAAFIEATHESTLK
jgi:hypothetical protein